MIRQSRWTSESALRYYRLLALRSPDNFAARFDWAAAPATEQNENPTGFSDAEIDAIYDEVIAKIPATATKVLEIGCGDGRFLGRLRAAKPALGYVGIDIVPENIATAKVAYPTEDLQIANVFEYLWEATADWDFVVSVGCLFYCTDTKYPSLLFQLLDAKAPKGFAVVADVAGATPTLLGAEMSKVLAASTNVAASYYTGARDFLTDATLKSQMVPFYIHRDGTSTALPESLPMTLRVMRLGVVNRVIGRQEAKLAVAAERDIPTDFPGVEVDEKGLVTGTATKELPADWLAGIKAE